MMMEVLISIYGELVATLGLLVASTPFLKNADVHEMQYVAEALS